MRRKEFIRATGALAASSLFFGTSAFAGISSVLRVGAIGLNNMGWRNLKEILKADHVVCTAICDVDESVLKNRSAELKELGVSVKTYIDYKELLHLPDVDLVIIGTPDHWHCLQMVEAVALGKHVYVEKPLGNSIRECEVMVAAVKKHKRMVQVGQWQRSQQHFREAIDFVQSGKLGKISMVKAWAYQGGLKRVPIKADEKVPAGVHYDKWLGPAPHRAFNPNRFHFNFRWFWDYGGGLMTDWGVHMLDFALMGMNVSDPISITASGGKLAFPDDAGEAPDTLTTLFRFKDFNLQWEQAVGIDQGIFGRNHGVAFIGYNGTLVLNRNGWEVIPERNRMEAVALQPAQDSGLTLHMQNLVDAIRKGDESLLTAPVEAGAHIAILSQMGNIAYRTGKTLHWNKLKNQFDESEANAYLVAGYHNGYTLP